MTTHDRIKLVRKELSLTQVEFGQRISTTQGQITALEKGTRKVSDKTIKLICSEFNVNENWLRTGKGNMFVNISRDEEIESFMDSILSDENESFKRRFISVLSRLDDSGWEAVAWFCQELYNESEEEKQKRNPDPSKIDIEAEVAAYRAQLELQVQAAEKLSASNTVEDILPKANES